MLAKPHSILFYNVFNVGSLEQSNMAEAKMWNAETKFGKNEFYGMLVE